MARLWYPDREDIEQLGYELAAQLFQEYESNLPAFALFGGERAGGALLDSALALPKQTSGGRPLYRSVYDKAAVLLRSIIKNHPLLDGNKRLGMATAALFLFMNGHVLLPSSEEMVRFALEVASSEPAMPWEKIAVWLREHSIPSNLTKRQAIELAGERFDDAGEIAERLAEAWSEIGKHLG